MQVPRRVRRVAVFVVAFAVGLWAADLMLRADTTQPATAPSTQPIVDAAAQAVLDRVVEAYAKLPRVVEGELSIDFDVAGMSEKRTSRFTGAAIAPTRFNHQIDGEVRIVADGKSFHAYDIRQNTYVSKELDAEKPGPNDFARAVLREQNPALLIPLSAGSAELFSEGEQVSLAPPSDDTKSFDVLVVTDGNVTRKLFVEKDSGKLDRMETDFSAMLLARGAREVNRAVAVVRYTRSDDSVPAAELFAFKPPADAVEARDDSRELMASGDVEKLAGKPAPELSLKDLEGNAVSLASLKGKVVIVDFWATWCPPCVASLPVLNELAGTYADRDVVILAVNAQEENATVKEFATKNDLRNLKVLLDADGAVNGRFGISGLPTTVVIGRDGVVRKAHVGFSPSSRETYAEEIEAALK